MPAAAAPVPPKLTALVAGGSGLVGGELLRAFAGVPEFSRVIAVSRRPLSDDPPKVVNRIVRFEALEQSIEGMTADVAFCCLGTTRAAAGSEAAFRAVDYDLVLSFGRAALKAGARRLVLVSSIGAESKSNNLYLRVKGEVEDALGDLGFPSLDILQPGLLLGSRKELRPWEALGWAVMPVLNPLLIGNAEKFRAIRVNVVAAAMLGAARSNKKGIHRYTHRGMQDLARPLLARPVARLIK